MRRRIINKSAELGSFYDARLDQVIHKPIRKSAHQILMSEDKASCRVITGSCLNDYELLRWIGLEDELCLSLLTKSTKREGIALVLDYRYPIDQNTWIMHYYWKRRTVVSLNEKILEIPKMDHKTLNNTTHVITSIDYGIEVLMIFHVSPDNSSFQLMDQFLDSVRHLLYAQQDIDQFLKNKYLLESAKDTCVYSNLPTLKGNMKIADILRKISKAWRNSGHSHPLSCWLEPVRKSSTQNAVSGQSFYPLESEVYERLLKFILPLRETLIYSDFSLNVNQQTKFSLKSVYHCISITIQFNKTKQMYLQQISALSKLISNIRQNPTLSFKIDGVLNSTAFMSTVEKTEALKYVLPPMQLPKCQTKSICTSQPLPFDKDRYYNQTFTEQNTPTANRTTHMASSNITRVDQQGYNRLTSDYSIRCEPKKQNISKNLIDFSVDSQNMKATTTSYENSESKTNLEQNYSTSNRKDIHDAEIDAHLSARKLETMNILLLGETGVGKSTFINALANYLTFDSLEQAERGEPIVLIPVSFLITSGPQFDERIITFGEHDASNNEYFNDKGQSVTQYCRSYTFDSISSKTQQIRIIDTPGFGDTRGIEQDHANMEHILQYISHLSHLNAICFLLKPNESKINIAFRTCFTQLFSLLDRTAHRNLIFCFTNARSTFYAPGNTGPLIQKMISELQNDVDIRFEKQNVYCFDNEAFRYLVAQRNGIVFSDQEQREYERSWTISVKESQRLSSYIEEKLTLFRMDDDAWQSVKHAELQISSLVQPTLETMRNQLRNLLLHSNGASNQSIRIIASPVRSRTNDCRQCLSINKVGPFWVKIFEEHNVSDRCSSCNCSPSEHQALIYYLEYQFDKKSADDDPSQLKTSLDELCKLSAELGRFFITCHRLSNEDPFSKRLVQMMDEEIRMAEKKRGEMTLNRELARSLSKILEQYENQMRAIESKRTNLSEIYSMIKTVKNNPLVKHQMKAVREAQKHILEETERSVHNI